MIIRKKKKTFVVAAQLLAIAMPFTGALAQVASGSTTPTAQPNSDSSTTPQPAFKGWSMREPTSTPPPREMTAVEKAVVERAAARQQLLASGDYKAAYAYLSASSQAFKPFATFEAESKASSMRETKATRAECDPDGRCSVTLVAKANLQQPRVGQLTVPVMTQEVWLLQPSGDALLILR